MKFLKVIHFLNKSQKPTIYHLKNLHYQIKQSESAFINGHALQPVAISKQVCDYYKILFCSLHNYHESLTRTEDDVFGEPKYKELIQPLWQIPESGHHVLVLQPEVGKDIDVEKRKEMTQSWLNETVFLIKSLRNWTVKEQVTLPINITSKECSFNTESMKIAKERVQAACHSHGITAVVISISTLGFLQVENLETIFCLPVYDRFEITLQLLKETARTREAKLQTAFAELLLIRRRLHVVYGPRSLNLIFDGDGTSLKETRYELLKHREIKLKLAIQKMNSKLEHDRLARKKSDCPAISVVGYTNAGKTSLIKALTKDASLEPKDQLFATLDVSAHVGFLPNQMKVMYLDTMGFISEIPEHFLHCFRLTLKDIALSDLIVHVRDVSHPSYSQHQVTVLDTLRKLKIPPTLLNTVVEVNNKVDKLPRDVCTSTYPFPVSSQTGEGIPELMNAIQEKVLK